MVYYNARKRNQQIDMNLPVHIKYSLVSIIDNNMSGCESRMDPDNR